MVSGKARVGPCSPIVVLLLAVLANLAGCASDLTQRQTLEQQQLQELTRQEGYKEYNAYSKAMHSSDPHVGEEFLERYPNSLFRPTVQKHIEELQAQKHFAEERTREQQRLCSLIPKEKQVVTRKFLIKIQGIFDSMESYHHDSLGSRYGGGILRKDIDRYTDAIAEATGAVPDPVIAYVEDAYQLLKRKLGSTDSDDWSRSLLKELTIRQFAAPTDLMVLCK